MAGARHTKMCTSVFFHSYLNETKTNQHSILKWIMKKKNILPLAGFEPATARIEGKWSIHYTTNTALSLPVVHSILSAVR